MIFCQGKLPFQIGAASWLPLKVEASSCWHKHGAAQIKPTFFPLPLGVTVLIRLTAPSQQSTFLVFCCPQTKSGHLHVEISRFLWEIQWTSAQLPWSWALPSCCLSLVSNLTLVAPPETSVSWLARIIGGLKSPTWVEVCFDLPEVEVHFQVSSLWCLITVFPPQILWVHVNLTYERGVMLLLSSWVLKPLIMCVSQSSEREFIQQMFEWMLSSYVYHIAQHWDTKTAQQPWTLPPGADLLKVILASLCWMPTLC